jgi:N-acylneuraminate cytidylyltransferase
MIRILGIIPARGGSKGLARKNIKILGGQPLVQYTIDSALASTLLSNCCLSSDDDEIIDYVSRTAVEVPFKRPAKLSEDTSTSLDVIKHAIGFYANRGEHYDAICLLQPTYPFRKEGMLDEAIEKFTHLGADSLISVLPVPHHFNPHWVFEPEANADYLNIATGEPQIISRRQDLPAAYYRDGAIYIATTELVMQQNTLFGNRLGYFESDINRYVNIDLPEDWVDAERKLTELTPK